MCLGIPSNFHIPSLWGDFRERAEPELVLSKFGIHVVFETTLRAASSWSGLLLSTELGNDFSRIDTLGLAQFLVSKQVSGIRVEVPVVPFVSKHRGSLSES